jgi:hypothetical protein
VAQARRGISAYFEFYNHQRLRLSLLAAALRSTAQRRTL